MDSISVKGKVVDIFPVVEKANFKKQELVIETEGDHPQVFLVEFFKEKTELLDFINPGETITISCNLRGREWTNPNGEVKYFLSLNGWKIDK